MSGEQLLKDPLAGFPDDVAELLAPHMAPPPVLLKAIGLEIVEKRNEAREARVASGVEEIWTNAEAAYIGIDDANRAQYAQGRAEKPTSMSGPVTTGREPDRADKRSKIYVRLTARYTDAAAAKLSEILLAPDDKSFKLSPTPVPDLIKAKDDNRHVYHDALGTGPVPLFRKLNPGEAAPAPGSAAAPTTPAPTAVPPWASPMGVTPPAPAMPQAGSAPSIASAPAPFASAPGAPPSQTGTPGGQPAPAMQPPPGQAPLTVADLAQEALDLAQDKASRAEDRIYGWMVKSQFRAEARKAIFDCARLGVMVIKAPFPKPKRSMALAGGKNGEEIELQVKEEIVPSYKWVNPWNIFPDPACGENIHDGDYILERDYLSERQVRELDKTPGYIKAQLFKVLAAGAPDAPTKSGQGESGNPTEKNRKGRYEAWYFYGALKLKDFRALCAAGYEADDTKKMLASIPKGAKLVYAIVTLIGDEVVRVALNPLDTGSFPYHSMPWQRRADSWAGIGVPEQMDAPQRITNGAVRALLDNAGLSAGCQIVIDKGSIVPADGQWVITPNKIWYRKADSQANDNRQAFSTYEIQNVSEQLKIIIDFGMQLAEESTSIPLITQGQSSQSTTPDTYGAAALQDTNANQLLRSIAESWDDNIQEPICRQSYEWLLLDPNVPEDEKGDFEIDAHGSVALVERAIQDQTILQLGATVANPVYGADPKRWFKQLMKSKRLKAEDFTFTEEEQAKIDANPVKPPQVQVAETRAASAEKIAAGEQALEGQKVNNTHSQAVAQATVDLHELKLKYELAILQYANEHKMNIDQVKGTLAKTAMTLQTQKELNAADNAADIAKERHRAQRPEPKLGKKPTSTEKPPVQTPGRAGNGRAFEQGR